MNYGGDAAEQVVRMSLDGVDVALRISGSVAKNLAVALAAILKEEEKTHGKSRLSSMLKSGKELTVFTVPGKDLRKFAQEAKKYGVLYCVVKDKGKERDGMVDVIARIEDSPKINRIVERFNLATVAVESKAGVEKHRTHAQNQGGAEKLIDEVLQINPQQAGAEEVLSGPSLRNERYQGTESSKRPSVREKVKRYQELEEQNGERYFERIISKVKKEKERE